MQHRRHKQIQTLPTLRFVRCRQLVFCRHLVFCFFVFETCSALELDRQPGINTLCPATPCTPCAVPSRLQTHWPVSPLVTTVPLYGLLTHCSPRFALHGGLLGISRRRSEIESTEISNFPPHIAKLRHSRHSPPGRYCSNSSLSRQNHTRRAQGPPTKSHSKNHCASVALPIHVATVSE